MTIKKSQEIVDEWINSEGVRYFNELTNMAILTEEVGELARIMARKYGEQSFKKDEENLDTGEEIADIFFVLLCIANQTGVDLTEEFAKGIKKRNLRDKLRHKENPALKDKKDE